MVTVKKICLGFFIAMAFFILPGELDSQSVKEMDRNAQKFLEDRDYNRAIALWLSILEIDPDNETAQRQIEYVYEIKQKKDLALQRAKLNFRIARSIISKNFSDQDIDEREARRNLDLTLKRSDVAFDNYETAMKIDPKDPEGQGLLEDMKRLESLVNAEKDRQRMALALQIRYRNLVKEGRKLMAEEKFEESLAKWKEILTFMPRDKVAEDGRRKAQLAVDNREKYETIKRFIARGKELFEEKKYQPARLQFEQAKSLDTWNSEARDYLDKIEEKLNEGRLAEQRNRQAEEFYLSGLQNIRAFQFDQARENFESVIALIKGYRDTEAQLASLDRLKAEYLQREREKRLQRINEEFQNGLIALSEGRYQAAVAAFEITLKLDPENKQAKQSLESAKVALRQQREELVDENSPYYNVINSLILTGKNLYDQGKYPESQEKWKRIRELFPKNRIAAEYILKINFKLNPDGFDQYATTSLTEAGKLMREGKYQEALRRLELVKSVRNDYPGIDRLIDEARQQGNRAVVVGAVGGGAGPKINATPAEIEQRYNRAVVLYQQGGRDNLNAALADFRFVVQADPNNIKAVISVNRIEAQLRIGVAAVAAGGGGGQGLTEEQRNLVRQFYYNGISLYSNNNFPGAIAEWRKVLAIDPNHLKAKNNIRKVLALMER